MKKVVISCGPIPARLDSVKFITNRFKGGLALKTAEYLINQEKYDVTIVKWQHTPLPDKLTQNQFCVHIVNVEDVFDYYNWYANHAAEYDAFIMAAAVANLTPSEPYKGKKGHYFMSTKSTGIIGRINDFGQLTIPKKLRRELKINDRTALELGITRVNGRKALYAVPYIPFEENTLRQVKSALTSLARQLPTGYEVGIFEFEESYTIAHASTGKSAQVEDYWFTVEPMARSMFEKARDSKHYGLCQFKGLNILYYPVFSHGDVLLVLAIAGKDIPDDVAEPVRMTAEILSAMLS